MSIDSAEGLAAEKPSEVKLTFESAMARLEKIVREMESGQAPLESSLALFEEGSGLIKYCSKMLDAAEQKVSLLTAGADGAPVEDPFIGDA